ncbi:MAG TPA: hydroxymethylbilane synthase [Longimicrobiaceae bacterium]|nr:hydroxymethylbilane synthase [Longimicrobiaceae bacterium]
MSNATLRIVSRGSQLALWQSHAVEAALRAADPSIDVSVDVVKTKGDRILDVPLAKIGDKGLFTKELDEALLAGRADLAVHSLKDVPTRLPDGLVIAAVTTREDPRDVLIARDGIAASSLAALASGARVGTSSLRRRAQLMAARADLRVDDLRGNLNTRLAKLDAGSYDAIILAAAGVLRLGWADRVSAYLEPDAWLPAVGQGALAVVARTDDPDVLARLAVLHDACAAAATTAERALLGALEGGCQIPIGALGSVDGERLALHALVADLDGLRVIRTSESGTVDEARAIGLRAAESLKSQGASDILERIRANAPDDDETGDTQ